MAEAPHNRVKAIFAEALEISVDQRATFLDQECGNDAALRAEVEALLSAAEKAGEFLGSPTRASSPAIGGTPINEGPGAKIGPYKLLQLIGEGGFGSVFMAEQESPVRRRVALKIIKLGMDTRQVVARFEAERQALAMMDHPNIAKVFDGGATETGRPFFVMELVRGTPITTYCDQQKLSISQRLELFAQVCQAVQHAHQKGLIHRDIKPSNVLVSSQDDRPAIKVIDFGIAKATQARLTEKTLFTDFHQLVGTPEYMSPEQAEGGLDIDTRSDVYSLGVLLYELLAGVPPFDPKELRSKAYGEIQRIIREVEPPAPSTRLSSHSDTLPSVAAQRGVEPRKLQTLVRGELDWIVMRCLEKDRKRRYQSAGALAEDLQHYLTDQPVEARRPTRAYRLKKFIRRNKLAVFAGTAIVAALAIGLAASLYFAATASREAKRATAALAQAEVNGRKAEDVNKFFTEEVFGLADPMQSDRPDITLLETIDRAATKVNTRFPDDPALRAEVLDELGEIYTQIDQSDKAVSILQQAIQLRQSFAGDKDPALLKSRTSLGWGLFGAGRLDEARSILQSAMEQQTAVLGPANPETLQTTVYLVVVLKEMRGEIRGYQADPQPQEKDLEIAQNAYRVAKSVLGPGDPATLNVESELSWDLRSRNQDAEALPYAQEAAAGLRHILGPDNPTAMFASYNEAVCLFELQRYDEAIAVFRPLVASRNRILGPLHRDSLYASRVFAESLRKKGDAAGALAVLDGVYWNLQQSSVTHDWRWAEPIRDMVWSYEALERYDRASELLSIVYRTLSAVPADQVRNVVYSRFVDQLAEMLITYGNDKIRNVPRGIELATKACELTDFKNPEYLQTLITGQLAAGQWQQTEQTCRRQIGLLKNQIASYPQDLMNRTRLIYANLLLTKMLLSQNELHQSGAPLRDAMNLLDSIPAANAGLLNDRAGLGHLLWQIGDALLASAKNDDARKTYEHALKYFEALATDYPQERFYRQETAFSHRNLYAVDAANGQLPLAAAELRQAIPIYEGLAAEAPESFFYRKEAQYCYLELADCLKDNKQTQQAIDACRKAIELQGEMLKTTEDRPDVFRRGVWLGQTLRELGQFDDAERILLQAVDFSTKLVAETNLEDHRYHLGRSYDELGQAYEAQQRLDKAVESYRSALDVWTKLCADFNSDDFKAYQAQSLQWLVEVLALQLQKANADPRLTDEQRKSNVQEFRDQVLKLVRETIKTGGWANKEAWQLATDPDPRQRDPTLAVELAKLAVEHASGDTRGDFLNTLGVAQYQAGQWSAAIDNFGESMELLKGGDSHEYFFLAMAYWQSGQRNEARTWYDKAIGWMDKNRPTDPELLRFRAEAAELLGIRLPNPTSAPASRS
jgi:serine/threonine protein kinase